MAITTTTKETQDVDTASYTKVIRDIELQSSSSMLVERLDNNSAL